MKAGGLAILPILTFLLAGTAATQDQDRQWNSCGLYDEHGKLQAGASPDLVIGACTVIIEPRNGARPSFSGTGGIRVKWKTTAPSTPAA